MINKSGKLLRSCLNMRREFTRAMDPENLTIGEHLLLRYVSASSDTDKETYEKIRAASLSEALNVSRPAISRILNSLEKRELISRKIDEKDRRGIFVTLTSKGSDELEKANTTILTKAQKIASHFEEDEIEMLIRLLDKLSDVYLEMANNSDTQERILL